MPSPSIWVEGSSLVVVDAGGTKRTLTGVSQGSQAGAVPGLIGVDRSNGRIVYIDANGVKRYVRYKRAKDAPGAAEGSLWIEGTGADDALKYVAAGEKRNACNSSCQESCQTSCQSSCQSSCESSCQSSCETSCQTTCEKSCQNCQGSCQAGCEVACKSGPN